MIVKSFPHSPLGLANAIFFTFFTFDNVNQGWAFLRYMTAINYLGMKMLAV
jgi:hypothetical protein